ncbi:MAG: molybdopterin-dependent oxidoreductase [Pseudomonadota bacterium]
MDAPAVKTTCPYCGVGCGVIATLKANGSVDIKGDPDHPANFGRLCSKGSALGETVSLEGRLLKPNVDGVDTDWDTALGHVAQKFRSTLDEHGPDSVAFYVSGQILTEDYYVANKLMKGFIGSANIDTNSRLCMASSVAGHKRAFGSDTVPGIYEDLELADLLVITGSNLAWCHPVLYQRIAAAKVARPTMKVVLIDPRRTMTADIADLHLPIAPDGDTALFNGLLAHLAGTGSIDPHYIAAHTNGFDAALEQARKDAADVEVLTGLDAADIERFYALFANTPKTVTIYSQGVNQSSGGTDKVNAIINCHLATGRIGHPGMGPFSVTGQPNAMGGREVGGLANMLAAHMEIANPDHRDLVADFWDAPNIASEQGLKAVDMFDAVADGRIKALWIMATNPVDSLPDADMVEAALRACPFVVVSDVLETTDTVRHAHVKLPSTAWGEKSGTVTNSERRISRQRSFLDAPGEAKADWWQLAQVAQCMGYSHGFHYSGPDEIFCEHSVLSAHGNDGSRDFDIGGFSSLSGAGYDALEPTLWPYKEGQATVSQRMFGDGQFFTPDGRARFIAVSASVVSKQNDQFPLILNTGRIRDQWHTMTRTGRSPRNSSHIAEPYCEIHPLDALQFGVRDASLVDVTSSLGTVRVRALVSKRQRQGSVFVPMHWTDQFASNARVDRLVPPLTDPLSGQPASKSVAVKVAPAAVAQFGFAVCRDEPIQLSGLSYWVKSRCADGWQLEFAIAQSNGDTVLDTLASSMAPGLEPVEYQDQQSSQTRRAWFAGDRLQAALFVAPDPVAVSRTWACEQLSIVHDDAVKRTMLVAGRPSLDQPDRGATVCSCFGVGINDIRAAIADGNHTIAAVGKACNAGTNCGSCQSEIGGLLDELYVIAAE